MAHLLLRRALPLIAVLAAAAFTGCRGADANDAGPGPDAPRTLPTSVPQQPPTPTPLPPATDPVAAVEAFVAAEADRDAVAAWSLLSAEDRVRYPTPAMWQTEHRQLPQLKSVAVSGAPSPTVAAAADPPGALDLAAEVTFDPGLDLTKGMVPARAQATWRVVPEEGGWRIAYRDSRFDAVTASEHTLAEDAAAWADARRRCRTEDAFGRRLEVGGGVVGVAGLAERLCGAGRTVPAGTPARIEAAEAAAVVAAFGPGALEWARVIALEGAVPQRVVLGPLGERWIAIGVLAA